MKCPYTNPTIQQCENCPLPDCTKNEDSERAIKWIKNNPEKRKIIRRRYYLNHRQSEINRTKQYRAENIEEIRRKDRERKARLRESQAG